MPDHDFGLSPFSKNSAFAPLTEAEKEWLEKRERRHEEHRQSVLDPGEIIVSKADIEEVYEALNAMVETAMGETEFFHHARVMIDADALADLRDRLYRNLR